MYSGHIAELALLWTCIVAFVGYHIWLYNFQNPFLGLIRVPATMSKARQVWTRSICADDKDVITGVQTIRNSLMTVTLFTVAAGYIGARAIPEILLTPDMLQQLNLIQAICKFLRHCCCCTVAFIDSADTLVVHRVMTQSLVAEMAQVSSSHLSSSELGWGPSSYAFSASLSQPGSMHIQ